MSYRPQIIYHPTEFPFPFTLSCPLSNPDAWEIDYPVLTLQHKLLAERWLREAYAKDIELHLDEEVCQFLDWCDEPASRHT